MKTAYIVFRHSRYSAGGRLLLREFAYKKDALEHAAILWMQDMPVYVENVKTKKLTYILPRGRSSCHVCGNELEGKKHCPLCNTFHYYT